MARMTASDFVTMARLALGGETTEALSDALILRFVNQAYLEVCSKYPFPELSTSTTVTTADGTAAYETTATDILQVTELIDSTNYVTLYPINESKYDQLTQGDSSSTSTPIYWYISGVGSNSRLEFTLFPTPDGVYTVTIKYDKVPSELVLSPTATSPIISAVWDDSILGRAIYRGWKHLGDEQRAMMHLQFAKDNDSAAAKRSIYGSFEPWTSESPIGRAVRG